MNSKTTEPNTEPTAENEKICLAYASLLWLAVRQALRASGAGKDPERLAEIEAQLDAGTASLGIYVQGDGARIFLSAKPMKAALQDPFEGNALRVSGPMVLSREQLARLGDAIAVPDRAKFN